MGCWCSTSIRSRRTSSFRARKPSRPGRRRKDRTDSTMAASNGRGTPGGGDRRRRAVQGRRPTGRSSSLQSFPCPPRQGVVTQAVGWARELILGKRVTSVEHQAGRQPCGIAPPQKSNLLIRFATSPPRGSAHRPPRLGPLGAGSALPRVAIPSSRWNAAWRFPRRLNLKTNSSRYACRC